MRVRRRRIWIFGGRVKGRVVGMGQVRSRECLPVLGSGDSVCARARTL
jgi:hypothetical protein